MIDSYEVEWVEELKFPLINRFYKSCGDKSKVRGGETVVALKQNGHYVAAVRLQRVEDWWFLRSLCVHPNSRRKGLATLLMESLQPAFERYPCYCFPYDYLHDLYQASGFEVPDDVPAFIVEQLERYRRQGRKIIVMTKINACFSSQP